MCNTIYELEASASNILENRISIVDTVSLSVDTRIFLSGNLSLEQMQNPADAKTSEEYREMLIDAQKEVDTIIRKKELKGRYKYLPFNTNLLSPATCLVVRK